MKLDITIMVGIGLAMLFCIIWPQYEQHKSFQADERAFMTDCQTDYKMYECTKLWKEANSIF